MPSSDVASFAVPLAASALLVAVGWVQLRRLFDRDVGHFEDVERLVQGFDEISGSAAPAAANRACALVVDLAVAEAAVFYRGDAGCLTVAGEAGDPSRSDPAPDITPDLEAAIVAALHDGLVRRDPLLVPVLNGRRIMGVVHVRRPRRNLDQTLLASLALAGREVGAVLAELRLRRPDLTQVDPVTGVWAETELEAVLQLAQPADALAIVSAGELPHPRAAGDILLAALAMHLRARIRPTDEICRHGEGAFVILLRDVRLPLPELMSRITANWRPPPGTGPPAAAAALYLPSSTARRTLELAAGELAIQAAAPRPSALV